MVKNTKYSTLDEINVFSLTDLKPYLSEYLIKGWKEDDVQLNYVCLNETRDSYTASYSMINYFPPSDGIFHFTVPLAFTCIAQLAIIGGCLDLELAKKPGEVYVRQIDLKCKKMINITDDIEINLQLKKKYFMEQKMYFSGGISVCNDSFIGFGSFVLPLPENFA